MRMPRASRAWIARSCRMATAADWTGRSRRAAVSSKTGTNCCKSRQPPEITIPHGTPRKRGRRTNMINRDIFEELFVLEMANNHWGRVDRGLKIVNTFAQVVRFNNVRAAIKLQFRDVDSFVHQD